MSMPALDSMLIVALTFLLAGSVKGVTGLGLPSVSLALLTATLGLKAAMAILIVPSFVTNVWQAAVGGYLLSILRRTWSLLLAVCIGTWFGVGIFGQGQRRPSGGIAGTCPVHLCRAGSSAGRPGKSGPPRALAFADRRRRERHTERHDRFVRRARGDVPPVAQVPARRLHPVDGRAVHDLHDRLGLRAA